MPDGRLVVDRTGRQPGRGAYLHGKIECLESARRRRALERALGAPIPAELWDEVSNSASPA
jgi:uncharacterized protein